MTTKWLARTYATALQDDSHEIGPTDYGLSQVYEANYAESPEEDAEPDIPVKTKGGRPKGAEKKHGSSDAGKIATRTQPVRAKRVIDPAGPDRPRPRRTVAEVKAGDARKAQLQIEIKELNERKLRAMAEIDAQEELDDEGEEHPGALARHSASAVSKDVADDMDVDSLSDKQANPELVDVGKAVPIKQKRTKKPAKGESRRAVEVATKAIKNKRKATAALEASAAKKQMSAFPSGLSRGWQPKNSAGKKPTGSQKKDVQSSTSASSHECDGLADDDAPDEAPPADLYGKERSLERTYKLIGISSDEDVSFVPNKSRPASADDLHKPTAGFSKTKSNVLAQKVKRESSSGDKVKRDPPTLTSSDDAQKVKHEFSSSGKVKHEPSALTSSDDITSTASESEIPRFAQPGWVARFLPTLFHRLSGALDPWDIGDGADTLSVIQGVFDKAYPGSGYKVTFRSRVYLMAKDRLNDRRTLLGRQAIKIVDAHFTQAMYKNQPNEIAAFARWAIRSDGPMIWQYPSPMQGVDRLDIDYIKPENIFESLFMIALLTPIVKSFQGSCYDYGKPQGAVALGAAALHRAFSMYKTGSRIEPFQFSRENVGTNVAIYGTNSTRLTNRRWAQIMTSYGVESDLSKKQKETQDDMLDEKLFLDLYAPSSPLGP